MLIIHNRKHGIDFYNIWYATELFKKKGIITYHEYTGVQPEKSDAFHTLVTDLTESEEDIRRKFSGTCRNLVNRAAREPVSYEIMQDKAITDAMIKDFCDFFVAFWESKEKDFKEVEKLQNELKMYRDNDALAIGYAVINGERAVYHTYIKDAEIVRLRHSASLYRLQSEEDGVNTKNLIGIANRGLHFEEMKYFKNQGKKTYDWGGAGNEEEVVHITAFKKSFGGTPVSYCNFVQVNGMVARIFKMLTGLLR